MSREKILFLISVIMIVLPHFGLTNLMEQISFFILGLVVMIFAYGIYFEKRSKKIKSAPTNVTKRVKAEVPRTVNFRPVVLDEQNGFLILPKPFLLLWV
jgi:predicted transcriptional regulator with HTH domain